MRKIGEIIKAHLPCPDCGSHDALALYDDGHTYCYSCHATHHETQPKEKGVLYDIEDWPTVPLKRRGITEKTCRLYSYKAGVQMGQPIQIACYFNDNGVCVGQKVRYPDKRFTTLGKISNRFFGQHLWPGGGGKKLVVTEGEIDCLTVSQLNGNKYPVVSIPNGVSSAKRVFKENMDWLNSFEQVIVMFDMDEPGRKAVKDVEGLLQPNKLYVATLPLKDPNECLLAGRGQEVIKAIWNAKKYTPDGIVNGADLWEEVSKQEDTEQGFMFPWDIPLNKMTCGLRKGELTVLTAGTGVGKTTFVRQVAYDLGVTKGLKVGLLMLEENVKRTARGLMSIAASKRLYMNRQGVSEEEYKQAFDKTLGTGHFILYEHFGSLDGDNLLSKIRYMAVGEQCDFIILDHISIAVSGLEGDNERKLIDILMTQLRSLAEETGVGLIVISHLKRIDGMSHEEGAATSLSQLRGSGAIAQLSDTVIGLERNQQADGEQRNRVRIRVLKNRWTGETGIAGYLFYNKTTDHLEETEPLAVEEREEAEEDGSPF